MKRIILASQSPRRKELLKKIGLRFTVVPSKYQEEPRKNKSIKEYVKYLSFKKAQDVALRSKNAIVIGVDTIGELNGELLLKPKNLKQARDMIQKISGKMHKVITAFTIIDMDSGIIVTDVCTTRVYFKKLTSQEIDSYLEKEKDYVLGWAASYAIQFLASVFIYKIEGNYDNVVGLPIFKVVERLKEFGVNVL